MPSPHQASTVYLVAVWRDCLLAWVCGRDMHNTGGDVTFSLGSLFRRSNPASTVIDESAYQPVNLPVIAVPTCTQLRGQVGAADDGTWEALPPWGSLAGPRINLKHGWELV